MRRICVFGNLLIRMCSIYTILLINSSFQEANGRFRRFWMKKQFLEYALRLRYNNLSVYIDCPDV